MLHVIRLFGLVLIFGCVTSLADNTALEKKYLKSLEDSSVLELSPGVQQRMREVTDLYKSDGFRNQVDYYRDNLRHVLNLEDRTSAEDKTPTPTDRPILFISSSIPLKVLRKYADQLDSVGGGTMVLKGFLGGSQQIMPTLRFIASVLNVDPTCNGHSCEKFNVDVIIDPVLFEHHGVERVPAFTVYESKTYIERCKGSQAMEEAAVVFGDASIRGLSLELMARDKRHTVERFIKKARYDR